MEFLHSTGQERRALLPSKSVYQCRSATSVIGPLLRAIVLGLTAATLALTAITAPSASATLRPESPKPTILQFAGPNGQTPNGAPNCYRGTPGVLDGKTWCYGVTYLGGANNNGAIYRVAPDGSRFGVLASFSVLNGLTPSQSPVFDAATASLYGTTSQAGDAGSGSIYQYSFSSKSLAIIGSLTGPVGTTPQGPPIIVNGALYGTTGQSAGSGLGGIWTMPVSGGKPTLIHSFTGYPADIATSFAGLTYNPNDGLIYAIAFNWGANDMGGISSFNPTAAIPGSTYQLRASLNSTTGGVPQMGALLLGQDGLMYGSGWMGGANSAGTVFAFDPSTNAVSPVHSLDPTSTGASPYNEPAESPSGKYLYGVSWKGGKLGKGAIYAINKASGQATVLLTLDGKLTGGNTASGVEVDPSGRFLITTMGAGGKHSVGTLISLQIPAQFR